MSEAGTKLAPSGTDGRLESWKEIASYLNRDVRTVQRWEKNEGLPVHRHLHDKLGSVYAFKSEIDIWWAGRGVKPAAVDEAASTDVEDVEFPADQNGAVANSDDPACGDSLAKISQSGDEPDPEPTTKSDRVRQGRLLWLAVSILVLLSLTATAVLVYRTHITPNNGEGVSVAVMPFTNLSGDEQQDYFSYGIAEELITQLGRQQGSQLRVLSLRTTETYKDKQKRIKQIAAELNVQYVLEGTVRRDGQRVRIAVHLVRGSDESDVWDESYDRDLRDILALQAQVADAIAHGISPALARGGTLARTLQAPPGDARPREVNAEAYEAYLKGRFFWNKRTPQDLLKALEYFQQATKVDASYAPAYVGVADCYALLGSAEMGAVAPNTAMPVAKQAVLKALSLDPTLAEAHASLAHVKLIYDWDWTGAEQEFRRAIELNPGYATAHQWYALELNAQGRTDEALSELRIAERLDPLSPAVKTAVAEAYYFAQRYERAAEASRRALEMDPNFILGYLNLGRALEKQGRYAEAVAALDKGRALSGNAPGMTAFLAHAYAAKGERQKAQDLLQELLHPPNVAGREVYVPAVYVAAVYGGMGDYDTAFRYLSQALQERCEYLIYLRREPMGEAVRRDPRYIEIIKRAGLE